jgi:vacuolar-type H+-ATPase subunit I/STV1
MPQPAPARFDAADRRALRASLLTAFGPALAFSVLVLGYALSAHVCQPNIRTLIVICIAFGALGCATSARALLRLAPAAPDHTANRRLRAAAIGLQIFSLLVMAGFGIALATVTPCG